jgi:hypothetical protein
MSSSLSVENQLSAEAVSALTDLKIVSRRHALRGVPGKHP